MAETPVLAEQHSFLKELVFHFKAHGLIVLRFFRNVLRDRTRRFPFTNKLKGEDVVSFSETELWNRDDNADNWILTAGKVQNLRIAAKKLNGVEVAENRTFSFWKHIGNPSAMRGYVIGREIREGCVVPTIAGGLCQLSNALYDAALKAGFEIVERHKHTRIIKGSLAEIDRDATVKWNYIDLRFRSPYPFRIEVEITGETLLVKFRGSRTNASASDRPSRIFQDAAKLNDCYSCGNLACFKHPGESATQNTKSITTWLLDEKWGEYEDYIKKATRPDDYFIVPMLSPRFFRISRSTWSITDPQRAKAVTLMTLFRSLYIRAFSRSKRNVFSMMLHLDKKIARAMVKHIPIESTHLVISQNLLPFLWAEGALGGRTFDVLMTRLPIEKLHQRLDEAHRKFPESKTLNDFRAAEELIQWENTALTRSRHVVTPHQEIAALFNNKAVCLKWKYPQSVTATKIKSGGKVLFPASSLGRKGAYEVRQLARELNLSLRIAGKAMEDDSFWKGIDIEKAAGNLFENIRLLVYPAYVEHQPRLLLKAIASGIPVVASAACGLPESENVRIVPVGDYDALKQAVQYHQLSSIESH